MFRAILKKLGFFKPSQASQALYGACVDEARREGYYTHFAVADTVDGRFDLICLMVSLVLHRIKCINDGGEKATHLGQDLFEVMFADMDLNLRALGVSDEGMKYRIREMSSAFMGRMRAYTRLLERGEADADGWRLALARNVFRSQSDDGAKAEALTGRVSGLIEALSRASDDAISRGDIVFPELSEPAQAEPAQP